MFTHRTLKNETATCSLLPSLHRVSNITLCGDTPVGVSVSQMVVRVSITCTTRTASEPKIATVPAGSWGDGRVKEG